MIRLRQKISGTFRSFKALVNFCRTCPHPGRRVRGYISTARKNGVNALEALHRVFLGKAVRSGGQHLVILAHADTLGALKMTLRQPPASVGYLSSYVK